MSNLVRKILKDDLPIIRETLQEVFGSSEYYDISRLGGMTNHSYKITRSNGEEFLVRIPGEGTEELINRKDERKSTELACKLGIDSELLYFNDDGRKVMRFIKDPKPMTEEVMKQNSNIIQAADIFRKLHSSGVNTGVKFEIFEMAALYEKIILENNVQLYEDYNIIKQKVMGIKSEIEIRGGATAESSVSQ